MRRALLKNSSVVILNESERKIWKENWKKGGLENIWQKRLFSLLYISKLAEVPGAARNKMVLKSPSRSGLRAQKHNLPNKTGLPYNFCFIKFLPSRTVEAVQGQNQAKNLSIKIYSSAKFHQDLSSSSDFYKEEIYIKLYILDVQNEWWNIISSKNISITSWCNISFSFASPPPSFSRLVIGKILDFFII